MRHDIQAIRGVSIIAVFLFHLFPEKFPNGFLGVDIFFVLSGFLMAKILLPRPINLEAILQFYYKRWKRICSVYYLVVIGILLTTQLLQSDVWWDVNLKYSIFSAFFMTNQLVIHSSGNYFMKLEGEAQSRNMHRHCWSISVEMQFYLIAPFILLAISKFHKYWTLKYGVIVGMLLTSTIINTVSVSSQFNFNFMPSRLWQFAIGIGAYLLSIDFPWNSKSKMEGSLLNSAEDCLVLLLFTPFLPAEVNPNVLRVLTTTVTATLLYRNMENNMVLTSDILIYIGNLSYVIYLVHFPVIVYLMQFAYDTTFLAIALTIAFSVLIHHCFEKPILKQGYTVTTTVTLGLFAVVLALQFSVWYRPEFWQRQYSKDIAKIIEVNKSYRTQAWNNNNCTMVKYNEEYRLPWSGHCVFEKGHGNVSVLLVGNSYAANQANVIHKAFRGNYSEFHMLAVPINYVFHVSHENLAQSEAKLKWSMELTEKLKPDLIIHSTRVFDDQCEPIRNIEEDPVLNEYNRYLPFYERFTKKILIQNTVPKYPPYLLNMFIEKLEVDIENIDKLHLDAAAADRQMRFARERYSRMNCSKCEVFDLTEAYRTGDHYRTFDENTLLAEIDNGIHMTPPMMAKLAPYYDKLIAKTLSEM